MHLMNTIDFKNTKLHTLYGRFLLPTLIAVISNSLYCIVDVYFISSGSGNMGIAALNIAMPIFTIYSAIGLLFGFGSATVMSIAEGRGKAKEKDQAFTLAVFFMIVIGFIIMMYTTLCPIHFAKLLGSSDVLLPYVLTYLKPICISSIPFIIMYSINIILRSDHNPKLAMHALLTGNVFNIIFDYIFVEVCKWGIFGAAFATSLSPVVILLVSLLHFKRKDRAHFTKDFMNISILKRILNAGAGSGMMELSSGIIIFIFNLVILSLSNELFLSAYGIVTNIAYVIKGLLNGFSQAAQPMISYYHGANEKQKSKQSFFISLYTSVGFSCILYILFILFSKEVCIPFSDGNPALIDLAAHGVILYFSCMIFMSFNTMYMNYLQAIEEGKISTLLAVCKGFIFVIASLFIFVSILGMDGVWISVCGAEILCFIICVCLLFRRHNV